MKYYINSETMGVKWMESIFTVFKGHRESLMCQSPWERERGEHIPPKMKSRPLRNDQEAMRLQMLTVCSRRSCICVTISRTVPLGCTITCRRLNRDRRSKRVLAGTLAWLPGPYHANLLTLDGDRWWGEGGHRDAQGLFCRCTSTVLGEQQRQPTLTLSLHCVPHHVLGARAVWGRWPFMWLVTVNWLISNWWHETVAFLHWFQ